MTNLSTSIVQHIKVAWPNVTVNPVTLQDSSGYFYTFPDYFPTHTQEPNQHQYPLSGSVTFTCPSSMLQSNYLSAFTTVRYSRKDKSMSSTEEDIKFDTGQARKHQKLQGMPETLTTNIHDDVMQIIETLKMTLNVYER